MKRFSFHLQALLKLRGHAEEQARQRLGEASARCQSIQSQIQLLEQERVQVFSENAGNDMGFHLSRALYLGRIEDRLRGLDSELQEAEQIRLERLDEYTKARREFESIKKIREKRYEEYRKEWFRQEGREIDDIANSRIAGGLHG